MSHVLVIYLGCTQVHITFTSGMYECMSPRQLQHRINPNYNAMTRVSMDLKVMLRSYKGYTFTLVVIDKVTNFMVKIQSRSEEIGEALIGHVFSEYSISKCMIMDQESAFMSTLINHLFKLGIKIKTVAPYNHQSLQAECGIKSLATILAKHYIGLGQYWPKIYHLQRTVIILILNL